jgi:predicted transcriptional regulator
MSDVTLTIRLPKDVHGTLESLAASTDRSRNYLIREAVARYVESEAEVIEGIRIARQELQRGEGIPHEDAMRRLRRTIDRVAPEDGAKGR